MEWKPEYIVNDFVPQEDRGKVLAELRAAVPAFAAKAKQIFNVMCWQWSKGAIPSTNDIEEALYGYLTQLQNDSNCRSIESGHLRVELEYEFEEESDVPTCVHGEMMVKFSADSWATPIFLRTETESEDFFFQHQEEATEA